jgi:single-strand DNA-binding protein
MEGTSMLNRAELLGNLTHDPELRYTSQGFPYCFIRLATNRYSGGQQFTDFHFVTAWHGHAERAAQELKTGDRVFVEARLETSTSARDDGSREERIRLVATRVLFLHNRRRTPRVEPSAPEHIADVIAEQKTVAAPEVRTQPEEPA